VETNIIFGAVTDPALTGKIRVTVIATGFNEQSMARKREEQRAVPKVAVNIPGLKKEPEKSVEQISMPLSLPVRHDKEDEPIDELARIRQASKVQAQPVAHASVEPAQTAPLSGAAPQAPAIDFPPFLKPETMRKESRVYVSKGSVITQYEDDMDVPTFLRKQMQ
jgi:hypothetical protein